MHMHMHRHMRMQMGGNIPGMPPRVVEVLDVLVVDVLLQQPARLAVRMQIQQQLVQHGFQGPAIWSDFLHLWKKSVGKKTQVGNIVPGRAAASQT